MNAQEARINAVKKATNDTDSKYAEIMTEITTAVNRGTFECYLYEPIHSAVKERLTNEGYTIQSYSERNETTTKISW